MTLDIDSDRQAGYMGREGVDMHGQCRIGTAKTMHSPSFLI